MWTIDVTVSGTIVVLENGSDSVCVSRTVVGLGGSRTERRVVESKGVVEQVEQVEEAEEVDGNVYP